MAGAGPPASTILATTIRFALSPYLGGQGEKEAMYPLRSTDSKGGQLAGKNRYVIHFAAAPPVNAFWSLTVYNAADKMLIDNPIQRYKVGSDTPGLKTRPDGSFEVLLQSDKPKGEFAANWLPAPSGPFYMILRLTSRQTASCPGDMRCRRSSCKIDPRHNG